MQLGQTFLIENVVVSSENVEGFSIIEWGHFVSGCSGVFLPLLQYLGCVRCETVDAPVGVSVPVADGDGEPPKVPPHHLDGHVLVGGTVGAVAMESHCVALASVVGLVPGAVGGQT